MDSPHDRCIGRYDAWRGGADVWISEEDWRRHLYIIGKTGTGKSTLLKSLMLQDVITGRGFAFLDPHGDLAHELLDYIPPSRTHDVIYVNPGGDLERPIGFNPLGYVHPDHRHVVAAGVVEAFKSLWHDSWGARLNDILANTVAALLDLEGGTLVGVLKMLTNDRYRELVVRGVRDPVIRAFWEEEYRTRGARFNSEADAAVLNKVRRFLTTPPLRNMLGQVTSSIDFRAIMDDRRIVMCNLSKAHLGDEGANLLGSLFVTSFQLAASARADQPEDERQDFTLYIDEFQNVTTDSIATILSEARKYRLTLVLAHQFWDPARQPTVRKAVFGNVGSIVAFRVGLDDAELLEREFGGALSAAELTELDNHEIAVRLLAAGMPRTPFRCRTLLPAPVSSGRRETVIAVSRRERGRRRAVVEEKLRRFLANTAWGG
jgi:hypothetical protein